MIIGVISDSHPETEVAASAIEWLLARGADLLVHAEGIVESETLRLLRQSDKPYFAVLGNNDEALAELKNEFNLRGGPFCTEFAGLRLKIMHHPFYLFDEEPAVQNEADRPSFAADFGFRTDTDRAVDSRRNSGASLAKNLSLSDEANRSANLDSNCRADRGKILIANSKVADHVINLTAPSVSLNLTVSSGLDANDEGKNSVRNSKSNFSAADLDINPYSGATRNSTPIRVASGVAYQSPITKIGAVNPIVDKNYLTAAYRGFITISSSYDAQNFTLYCGKNSDRSQSENSAPAILNQIPGALISSKNFSPSFAAPNLKSTLRSSKNSIQNLSGNSVQNSNSAAQATQDLNFAAAYQSSILTAPSAKSASLPNSVLPQNFTSSQNSASSQNFVLPPNSAREGCKTPLRYIKIYDRTSFFAAVADHYVTSMDYRRYGNGESKGLTDKRGISKNGTSANGRSVTTDCHSTSAHQNSAMRNQNTAAMDWCDVSIDKNATAAYRQNYAAVSYYHMAVNQNTLAAPNLNLRRARAKSGRDLRAQKAAFRFACVVVQERKLRASRLRSQRKEL
ncbi:metallophosphoesterase family protein [uncultured Campylobacter sp.]|uniref:metallophosphoesterase family protein n=1 Tax=uncultured Campylobacter sp. TaxID=218934 RepID=UPI00262D993D|nr:metallophosphoesterase family protein [uncultured Campylobacter sp.]